MKSKFQKLHLWLLPFAVCVISISSCKKILEVEPQGTLTREQAYRNVFDADAAVIGIYGKFLNLAKQYVVLNELRGDLMSVTRNSDDFLKQLNTHSVTENNPYTDPRPFYEVILNCNDVMKNFNIMRDEKKLKVDEYNQRYSDIASIRSWCYLQLGIHFGTVPYITEPLENVNDIKNESLYPRLEFRNLLAKLIETVENLPTHEVYPTGTLVTTVDQYQTQKFFINKKVLLGELHLWNGTYDNSSYRKAATAYRAVLQTATTTGATGENYFKMYRLGYGDVVNNNDIVVGYIRFRESDLTALIDNNTQGWRSIFGRGQVNYDVLWNYEWIWSMPFNRNFAPRNPFIDLFSNTQGSYLLKPSQYAIDDWNAQRQTNTFPFDARGRFTYSTINGQPVIMKYLYYTQTTTGIPSINANGRTGDWFLYRAATLHLHYAEAANRDGRSRLAYGMINNGISAAFDNSATSDNTNEMQTFDIPPYDFDARVGNPPGPVFRAEWHHNIGVRGRAYLTNLSVNQADSLTSIENMVVGEGGRELAYEGQRWQDLLRIAIRRDDPAFLADKIYEKLRRDGVAEADAVRTKLMNKTNWYLPFKWQ